MFGFLKKDTEVEKLQKKYNKLMKEWHKLSSINRSESDKKYAEAEVISKQLEKLSS